MAEIHEVRREGEMLDRILWERFGREDLLERTLLLNPGVAAGPVLPLLAQVVLPEIPADQPAAREVVRLWT